MRLEEASPQQLDPHRFEITRAGEKHLARVDLGPIEIRPLDEERPIGPLAAQRQRPTRPAPFDGRTGREPIEHVAQEPQARGLPEVGTGLRQVGLRQPDARRQHLRRSIAEIEIDEPQQAAHEETRAHEQQQRERHLADDEHTASVTARRARRSAGVDRSQDLGRRRARRQEGGRQPDEKRARRREGQDEERDAAREADLGEPGRRRRAEADEHVAQPEGEEQSQGAADQDDDRVLGDELPHQPGAAGAEGLTNGHLALARRGSRQQEAGDVGAGDRHDQRHRRHQQPQDLSRRSDQIFLERNDARRPAGSRGIGVGKLLRQRHAHGREPGLCLRHRELWSNAGERALQVAREARRVGSER